jgi:hypothetical protein
MRALLMLVLLVVVIGGGLKMAGVPLPFIDYSVGPVGGDAMPGVPGIEIQQPNFEDRMNLP